jgi:hypothetical protein
VLTGGISVATIVADPVTGTCTADVQQPPGVADCSFDATTDPANPYIIAQLECPAGTVAIQAGCVGTGPQGWLISTVQDTNVLQCFYRIPPNPPQNTPYAVSVTGTCVELSVVSASGKVLKASTLLVKDFSFAKLKAKIMGQ